MYDWLIEYKYNKLINFALVRRKFIKDELLEINRNIKKPVNTVKFTLAMVYLTLIWLLLK